MSPGWWDRWHQIRPQAVLGPEVPSDGRSSTGPARVVVLMPGEWSALWNKIRQWHENSSATRVRVAIWPPIGPRQFRLDSDVSSSIELVTAGTILIDGSSVGVVELGYPGGETSPAASQSETNLWAKMIAEHLLAGSTGLAPPSQAA